MIKFDRVSKTISKPIPRTSLVGRIMDIAIPNMLDELLISDVSLQIEDLGNTLLISSSRSSAQMILKLISKVTSPSKGKVINENSSAIISSSNVIWKDLTASEYLKILAAEHHMALNQITENAEKIAGFVGLQKKMKIKYWKLQKDEQKILDIVVTISHLPKVLLINNIYKSDTQHFNKTVHELLTKYQENYKATIVQYVEDLIGVEDHKIDRVIVVDGAKILVDENLMDFNENYNNTKELVIEFGAFVDHNEVARFGEIVNIADYTYTLSVPRNSEARITSSLVRQFPVTTIRSSYPEINKLIEVIKKDLSIVPTELSSDQ